MSIYGVENYIGTETTVVLGRLGKKYSSLGLGPRAYHYRPRVEYRVKIEPDENRIISQDVSDPRLPQLPQVLEKGKINSSRWRGRFRYSSSDTAQGSWIIMDVAFDGSWRKYVISSLLENRFSRALREAVSSSSFIV